MSEDRAKCILPSCGAEKTVLLHYFEEFQGMMLGPANAVLQRPFFTLFFYFHIAVLGMQALGLELSKREHTFLSLFISWVTCIVVISLRVQLKVFRCRNNACVFFCGRVQRAGEWVRRTDGMGPVPTMGWISSGV